MFSQSFYTQSKVSNADFVRLRQLTTSIGLPRVAVVYHLSLSDLFRIPFIIPLSPDTLSGRAAVFQDTAAVDVLAAAGPGLTSPSADRASLLVRCDPRLAPRAGPTPARRRR